MDKIPHDGGEKEIYSSPQIVKGLIQDVLSKDISGILDFNQMRLYPNNFINDDLKELRSDTVWQIKLKGKEEWAYIFLMLEYQSAPDHWMALRILRYMALLWGHLLRNDKPTRKHGLPPIFPIVIYTGKRPWHAPVSLKSLLASFPSCLEPFFPDFKYYLIDESKIPKGKLAQGKSLTASFLRLKSSENQEEFFTELKKLKEFFKYPEYAHLRRLLLVFVAKSMIQSHGIHIKDIDKATTDEECETVFDAVVADILCKGKAIGLEEGKAIGLEKGEAIGLEKGEAIGLEKGEAIGFGKGEAFGLGKALISTLETKFGKLPENFKENIASISDPALLNNLLIPAITAESLPVFMEIFIAKVGE